MSLVERALKKLQESRVGAPIESDAPTLSVGARAAEAVATHSARHEQGAPSSPKQATKSRRSERTVVVDKNALRAMELLPPVNLERQIASQYQQIKRPLIASALGKGSEPIPNAYAIMLASALPGEGKTFTSINLALSMALERDIEIILIDADVAKPHVTRIFDVSSEKGLLDLLADSSLDPESAILDTNIPGLSLLPAGRQTETATELLASARMEQLIKQLAGEGGRRILLFDSPPLLLSTESRALVHAVGQVVLVVRAEVTPRRAVQEAIEAIGESKPTSLILNQTSTPASGGYYGYGTYGDSTSSST